MTLSARKTALITGASSGLGAEFALQLAGKGYDLVLSARRADRLQQVADSIQSKYGVQVHIQPADLSSMADIEGLISHIHSMPNLDLLVNNAGFGTVGRFTRVDPEKELAMLNIHVVAPVMFCRAAIPGMLSRNSGSIINVSSLAGLISIRNVVYHSSKAFLVSFSEGLSAELRGTQVHIQVLCPGYVTTGFHDTAEYSHSSRNSIPQFLWMTPSQVVSESLKMLNSRKLICIPGPIYRFAGALARNSITAGLIRFSAQFVLRKRKTFINS